jgi:hypothetical protein
LSCWITASFELSHPGAVGSFSQYVATSTPAQHDKHAAVFALQHAFFPGARTFALSIVARRRPFLKCALSTASLNAAKHTITTNTKYAIFNIFFSFLNNKYPKTINPIIKNKYYIPQFLYISKYTNEYVTM